MSVCTKGSEEAERWLGICSDNKVQFKSSGLSASEQLWFQKKQVQEPTFKDTGVCFVDFLVFLAEQGSHMLVVQSEMGETFWSLHQMFMLSK